MVRQLVELFSPMPAAATVLVLEDEALIALDVESMLADAGCKVMLAENIDQARRRLAADGLPAVALLDILLPDGTCFALARELAAGGVRIVFLTGYSPGIPADLAHCPVIDKPFTADILLSTISPLLGARSAQACGGERS